MDLSSLNTFQQAILFILLILGSAIFVSLAVLMVRKQAFDAKFRDVSEEMSRPSRGASIVGEQASGVAASSANELQDQTCKSRLQPTTTFQVSTMEQSTDENQTAWDVEDDQITVADTISRPHHHHRVFPMAGVGARPDLNNHPRDAAPAPMYSDETNKSTLMGIIQGTQKYFSSKGLVGRNSQFHGLTSAERERLGGVEYKAVSFLSVVVALYLVSFLLLGIIGMGAWLQANHPEVAEVNGLSPFWTGAFFAVSAFVNSGMALLDKNMTALQLK